MTIKMMESDSFKDKHVLVTGARGFVGSVLTKALVHAGANVTVLAHYGSGGGFEPISPEMLGEIEVIQGDITDPYCVRKAVTGQNIVFHLAALISVPYSYQVPQAYVATNIGGTLNVLQACHDLGTAKVVHTSTAAVYGPILYSPVDESHPLQAQSPYSASKIGADKFVESYYRSYSLPVVTVRPFNTYGPGQSVRAVIPTIISQILSGQDTVYLGALHPELDLTFVDDMANGFMKAAVSTDAVGKVVNFGSGKGISVKDLALKIADILGVKITLVSEDQRIRPESDSSQALVADSRLAGDLCGWAPEVDLDKGLQLCIDFVRENPALYRSKSYKI